MPNSPLLWVAAGMLWIMDASINISMEPFRAFVGDMLPAKQRTIGFSMQSFFIGTGAIIASALPYMMTNWLGIANTAPRKRNPRFGEILFLHWRSSFFPCRVVDGYFRSKEYSPEELKKIQRRGKQCRHQKADSTNLKFHLHY